MAEVLAGRMNDDMLNELLIARLLEEDMVAMENMRAAEEVQLNEALATSALAAGRFPRKGKRGAAQAGNRDADAVLDVFKAEVKANRDALMAQALQHAEESKMAASRQYAQKLAAAERKAMLDAEFAKRLQEAFDNGEELDERMLDAERWVVGVGLRHRVCADNGMQRSWTG